MRITKRLQYWRRVFSAYFGRGASQLSFWHETPAVNPRAPKDTLGEYYMTFDDKAKYEGPFDEDGVPMLDYRGEIGRQYNPIAVAQYGLAAYNQLERHAGGDWAPKVATVARWLVDNLEPNGAGIPVWQHHFDWEYRDTLVAPWYSGLAQGQGISLLVRAHRLAGDDAYATAAERAFESLRRTIDEGGVIHVDRDGYRWIEEYIVDPPTHILNGFMWAAWGVRDWALATGSTDAKDLWEASVETLVRYLPSYDAGFWSLYEHSGTRLKMMASPFYHSLHIVQLKVMHRLTGIEIFDRYATRWESFQRSKLKQRAALAYKGVFKLCYY
jgi:heparosan-N-sulfate-glucuronate 5-epimerase